MTRNVGKYICIQLPGSSREINECFNSVEDSNAEKNKIKEVEEPEHIFCFEE